MARWLLKEPHYLNSPRTNWRYTEIDQDGEAQEHNFPVPRLMDPKDPRHWTNKADQTIVVCYEGKGNPGDRIFTGPPTPGMEPLDEEAQAISAQYSGSWVHPIDTLPGNGQSYADGLLKALTDQLTAIGNTKSPSSMLPNQAIKAEDFAKLQEQVAELMKANQALVGQLTAKVETSAEAKRRAV
jgi:hypothetical protein